MSFFGLPMLTHDDFTLKDHLQGLLVFYGYKVIGKRLSHERLKVYKFTK